MNDPLMSSRNAKLAITSPIPITIISGFLGAGKTSLLTYILESKHDKRIAVLVNDFGQLNIDAEQISTIEGETISLTNGCICCTIRDDLLTEVLKLFENKVVPEHIIIEASGISDPTLVAHTFLMPAMQGVVEVDSIISVVDSEQLLELDEQFKSLAQKQIRVADLILINKIDLVNTAKLKRVHQYVKRLSSKARILETVNSKAPLHLLLGTHSFDSNNIHDVDNRVHVEFDTWIYQSDEQFTFIAIRKALEDLPSSIYRVKGFIHLEAVPNNQGIFQMTGGRAWLRLGEFWHAEKRKTRLVFIGKKSFGHFKEINAHFDKCQQKYCREQLDKSPPIMIKDMKALSIVFG